MYRKLSCFLALLFIISIIFSANVSFAKDAQDGISARSAVVMDAFSHRVLYQKNSAVRRPMASTTKVMTCLLACESGRMQEVVTVTEAMLDGTEGSLIYLKAGDTVTLSDLVKGAMIASGNDAANAIAVFLSGSVEGFVNRMNERARLLGMEYTTFVTPSGLDGAGHKSTAYDMALLSAAAVQNETLMQIAAMTAAEITISGVPQTIYNHNKLLHADKSFIGLKTGYTKKAGRCLLSAYRCKDSVIVTVTLSAPDDWNDHQLLVKRAKKQYRTHTGAHRVQLHTVGAKQQSVSASYHYTVHSVVQSTVKEYYYPFVYAPVSVGQKVGRADIYIANTYIKSTDIITTEGISLWQITK